MQININKSIQVTNIKVTISVILIWLFQITAIIGYTAGFGEWFISKTPLNLLLVLVILLINFPFLNAKVILAAVISFSLGFFLEWIGVHNDFLFGSYSYGQNLGFKIDDVPILIGVNWMVLTFISITISNRFIKNKWLCIVFSSLLMLTLDFFMESSAPIFDFWCWEKDIVPLQNFITWFIISLVLNFINQKLMVIGNYIVAINLYLSQLLFFIYFYGYFHF